ncbi:hypothetical protein OG422_31200 (plasmid) [Streptomyces sp. NBC_01525]|uniref:hypothetical protein n=1 Tax=Streptomyces sp. NBC_01525 TaxID=2903893 RepID=UPI002F912922
MTPAQLSLGGLALAVIVLVFTLVRWWRNGHPAPSAAALAGGLLIGLLGALCSGGLLGLASHLLVTRVTNPLGNKISGGGSAWLLPHVAPATGLTPGGAVTTVVLLGAVILAWICCDNDLRRKITAGAVVGTAAGLIGAVSGLAAATLIPAANALGDHITASLPFQ